MGWMNFVEFPLGINFFFDYASEATYHLNFFLSKFDMSDFTLILIRNVYNIILLSKKAKKKMLSGNFDYEFPNDSTNKICIM